MKHIRQPEFKLEFRAFHRPTQRFFTVAGFDAEFVWDEDGKKYSRHDCEIDQWTGLLDQEEVKIYANDVLEVFNHMEHRVGLFRVVYVNLQGRYVLDGLTANTRSSRLTLYQKVRIVDNVHANPDLLNSERVTHHH